MPESLPTENESNLVELDICCPDCHCSQWEDNGDNQYNCPRCGYFLSMPIEDRIEANPEKPQVLVITPDDVAFASQEENEAAKALACQMFRFVDLIHNAVPALYRHEAITLTSAVLLGISESALDDPQTIAELEKAAEKIIESRGE